MKRSRIEKEQQGVHADGKTTQTGDSADSGIFVKEPQALALSAAQKERLQLLWWLKTGQVSQHQELSQRLGRSPACITRWLSQYRQGGIKQLLVVKTAPGAEPKIQGEALEKLQARLKSEAGCAQLWGDCRVVKARVWVRAEVQHRESVNAVKS